MSRTLGRLLPIVVGVGIGWLIFHPPAWLGGLGWAAYLVTGSIAVALLLSFVAATVSANLPSVIRLEPVAAEALGASLVELGERYRALGFDPAGPPTEVGVSPPGIMLPFVHPGERTYGTAFRTGTVPEKIAFDFFSYLEGDRGGLTSSAEPMGATLPSAPGDLRQVIPGATIEQVLAEHRAALAFLAVRGLSARAVNPATFTADFRAAIARQRRHFFTNTLLHAAIAVYRTATRSTPHLGPLEKQAVAQRQIQALLTGRRG